MKETDPQFYILKGKEIVGTNDVTEWASMIRENKRVAEEYVGDKWISTVFLGVDHNFGSGDVPVLFETMVFNKTGPDTPLGDDLYQERCRTYDEAEAMHKRVVAMVKNGKIKNENGESDTD